jgi:hypothetical protein
MLIAVLRRAAMTAPASPETPVLEEEGVVADRSVRYPQELRERAVRLVEDCRPVPAPVCAGSKVRIGKQHEPARMTALFIH